MAQSASPESASNIISIRASITLLDVSVAIDIQISRSLDKLVQPIIQPLTNAAAKLRGSAFSFSFDKPADIAQAVQSARTAVQAGGGTFSGNDQEGNFKISGVTGQYRVQDKVQITIISKPFIVTQSYIEREVKKYFSK
jgi:hypothetical protein